MNNNDQPVTAPKQVSERLRQVVARGQYAILDTETTGKFADKDQAVQLSLVRQDGVVLMDHIIKPTVKIPPDASAIHGITDETAARFGKEWAEVFQEFMKFLNDEDLDLVVYNAGYDVPLVITTCRKHNVDPAPFLDYLNRRRATCAMLAYAEIREEWNDYRGNWRWHRLGDACRFEGLSDDGAHNALADCRMTLALIQKRFPVRPPLPERKGWTVGMTAERNSKRGLVSDVFTTDELHVALLPVHSDDIFDPLNTFETWPMSECKPVTDTPAQAPVEQKPLF